MCQGHGSDTVSAHNAVVGQAAQPWSTDLAQKVILVDP